MVWIKQNTNKLRASKLVAVEQSFYGRHTVSVARDLLGYKLVHRSPEGMTAGLIVETEAYLQGDPACHANRGMTPRNRPMFGPPGHAYVYFIYGLYFCFNVVSGPVGVGEAVLIRALEPQDGIELMQQRRGRTKISELCSGPAKLVQAMGIGRQHNNLDLTGEVLFIVGPGQIPQAITATTRIGIKLGQELPLRFYVTGSPYISKK